MDDKTSQKWLENKKKLDDTDGLWRIHDNLYDVSSFIDKHPGGQFWLEETRGMDITESFESHHINSEAPRLILDKFFVKKAIKPRTSVYTFDPNGFYKTLQRKASNVLKTLPKKSYRISQFYADVLLVTTLAFACMSMKYSINAFAILASISGSCLIVASHNFCHQRDNLRMYYGELLLASVKEVRIIHVLSHHAFPNSRQDFQVILSLPIFNLFPEKKSFFVKYLSWIFSTAVIYPFGLHLSGLPSAIECFVQMKKTAIFPLILPASMYIFGGGSILMTILAWQAILMMTSAIFLIVANTTSHLHPDLYMEGDARREKHELDWGIYQMDTIYERDIDNQFVTLVTFGNHVLHHLFPTLDNSYLKHLYPVLEETLKEFNIKTINVTTYFDLWLGYIKQAGREIPKTLPPFLEKVF